MPVTQIDVTLEGETHTITSSVDDREEDAERIWCFGETELEIEDFQTALEALTADSFTEEQPGAVEEISLTLHLDNANVPTAEIQLYRYDGSFCLAVADGEPVSLVTRASAMELVEAVQAIILNG